METVCALSVIGDKRGTSGRKMADFMMDGLKRKSAGVTVSPDPVLYGC